jgi:four helix bundle protein
VGKLRRYEDMEVWISARALVRGIYAISGTPLFSKDYGLRDQIRRASVSIASNIAEGSESQSNSIFAGSFTLRVRLRPKCGHNFT